MAAASRAVVMIGFFFWPQWPNWCEMFSIKNLAKLNTWEFAYLYNDDHLLHSNHGDSDKDMIRVCCCRSLFPQRHSHALQLNTRPHLVKKKTKLRAISGWKAKFRRLENILLWNTIEKNSLLGNLLSNLVPTSQCFTKPLLLVNCWHR